MQAPIASYSPPFAVPTNTPVPTPMALAPSTMIPPVLLPAVPPPRLVPRSVPEMVDEGVRAVRRDFGLFASIAAFTVIPANIVSALVTALFTPFNLFNPTTWFRVGAHAAITADSTVTVLITSTLGLVNLLLTALGTAALIAAAGLRTLGQPCDVGMAYRQARRRYWAVIGTETLIALAVSGITVCTVFIGTPFALFLYVAWQLAPQSVVLEGCRPIAAMRRSMALTKGGWWRLIALLLILGGLQLFATAIPGGVGTLVTSFTGSKDLLGGGVGAVIVAVLGSLIAVVFLPISVTVTTLFFTDQRLRREGFDIDILLQRAAAERSGIAAAKLPDHQGKTV